ATEEHAAQAMLGLGVALQRGLLEPAQCLRQFARGALAVVVVLTEFELSLGIAVDGRLAAGSEGVWEVFRQGVERAATGRRNQQRVVSRLGKQRKKHQATQEEGAAGAVHERNDASG